MNAINVVDEVEDEVIPPQSIAVEGFRSHRLDREKSKKYIKKMGKESSPELRKMIMRIPLHIDNKVERNTLEAVDSDGGTVMRFNLKKTGAVFV